MYVFQNKLYDCIVKSRTRNHDSEHKAFLKMVLDVRSKLSLISSHNFATIPFAIDLNSQHNVNLQCFTERFVYTDEKTNPGHVRAARSGGKYPPNTSIKILVHHAHSDEPFTFTSDGEIPFKHLHKVCVTTVKMFCDCVARIKSVLKFFFTFVLFNNKICYCVLMR